MEILLVNDDGIYAEGILTLARVLSKRHNVVIVAPHKQMSGTSHSLTFNAYLNYQQLEIIDNVKSYALNGTPADCVKFGIDVILKYKPDLVLSGINKGHNLGTDVIYSGTVNAAVEASVLGIKAIAFSQSVLDDSFLKSAEFINDKLDKLVSLLPQDSSSILSINFPPNQGEQYKGSKVTTVGWRVYNDEYNYVPTKGYYITGHPLPNEKNHASSDEIAVGEGYVSISPIKVDFNDIQLFENIKDSIV